MRQQTTTGNKMKQLNEQKLAERIQMAASTLSSNEKALADALALRPDVAAFESLRRFAELNGVTPSMLSRFVSKLGYASYRDLQVELRTAVTRMIPSPSGRAQAADEETDAPSLLRAALGDEIEQLQQLHELLRTEAFTKTTGLIARAKGTVYVIGNGWSRSFADLMSHRLALCRPRVESSSSLDVLGYGKLAECSSSDCAIVIATRRYSRRTVELARAMRARGVTVIAITDSSTSPLVQAASHTLVAPNMRSGPFDSPTPIVTVIHLLCIGVTHHLRDSIKRRLGSVDALSEELGVFVSPSNR